MIDLSLEINAELQVFPGSPQPLFMKWTNYEVHSYESEIMMMVLIPELIWMHLLIFSQILRV